MTTDVAQASIPVPEPGLTGAEPIARAEQLRPHYEFQRPFRPALSLADAAEATVIRSADQYMEYSRRGVEGGEPFTSLEDTRLYTQLSMAFRQAWEAMELLFRTAGSSAAKNGERMQRYFRDVAVARTQFAAQYDRASEWLAREWFGIPRF